MTLLSPLYLAAAAGVVVPILIHLFGRPRPRHVRFPSLRLLRVAHRERHSSVRLQRLLSLILRCLGVLLLAAALALPTAHSRWLRALGRPLGTTAILIDVSASMRAGLGEETRCARARVAARRILAGLPRGEPVLLAGAGASLHARGEEPLPAWQAAAALDAVRATDERGRLGECLAFASASLTAGPATTVLITDMQASSLDTARNAQLPRGTRVVVVDVGAPPGDNLAIVEASLRDRPVVRGRPRRIDAELRAFGDAGGRVPVTLMRGGQVERAAATTLPPGGTAAVRLELTPRGAGVLIAEVHLPSDDLTFDDRRAIAAVVRDRLRVVVVGDAETTRFIRAALDPFPAGDERSSVNVTLVDAVSLSAANLEEADAVILAEPAALSTEAPAAIRDAVQAGTGVLVYAGTDAPPRAVLTAVGLRGVRVGDVIAHEDGLALAEFATRRPPLDAFAEPGAGDLSAARFTTTRPLMVEETAATVLARFDDGTPALVEAPVGRGIVLLLASAADDAWTDLPRLAVYVPLMHTFVRYLAAGNVPTALDVSPGELAVGHVPADAVDLSVITPNAESSALERVREAWRFTPDLVGAWRVLSGEEDICAFAVNLDPAESDPTRADAAELSAALQPADVTVIPADDIGGVLGAVSRAVDISVLFAFLALLAFAADAVLMQRGDHDAPSHG